jgi:hypothetical protein
MSCDFSERKQCNMYEILLNKCHLMYLYINLDQIACLFETEFLCSQPTVTKLHNVFLNVDT